MNSKEALFLSKLNDIKKLIEEKRPKAEIARFLGVKYETLTNYFKKYSINYDGNQNRRGIPHNESRKSIDDILNNKIIYKTSDLKKRLIEEGLKENKCECCGITNWNGKEICMELHHVDGNHYNNNLDNLQILCPNCHSQTIFFRGRKNINSNGENVNEIANVDDTIIEINNIINSNIKPKIRDNRNISSKKQKINQPKKYCKYCGKEIIGRKKEFCNIDCYNEYRAQNTKRPDIFELLNILEKYDNNLTAVGKYYGVSDNSIRKWKKLYKI